MSSQTNLISPEWSGAFGIPHGDFYIETMDNGTKAMVKRSIKPKRLTEEEILDRLKDCEFIIKVFKTNELQSDFKLIYFELCEKKLTDLCHAHSDVVNETEILFQIAQGMEFIHSKKIVHANVTPQNILLTEKNGVKIAGFEYSQLTDNDGYFSFFDHRSCGTIAYLAPEILDWLRELQQNFKRASTQFSNRIDLFSAGCTFFVFLTKGHHPFGNVAEMIPSNICEGDQVNEKELPENTYASPIIHSMIRRKPEERVYFSAVAKGLKFVLESKQKLTEQSGDWAESWYRDFSPSHPMTYDARKQLGVHNKKMRSNVFVGTFRGKPIAVRRILDAGYEPVFPFDTLMKCKHPNVLRLLHVENDSTFTYIGIELCSASLWDYYRRFYEEPVPSHEEAFQQMTDGLVYVHSQGLVHGAIRPTKVLISLTPSVHLKLAEFGVYRSSMEKASSSSDSGKHSKEFYFAPELLRQQFSKSSDGDAKLPDAACDVFALGCIFYTYLTKGGHPFHENGTSIYFISPNIINGNVIMQGDLGESSKFTGLIKGMIQGKEKRLTLEQTREQLFHLQSKAQ